MEGSFFILAAYKIVQTRHNLRRVKYNIQGGQIMNKIVAKCSCCGREGIYEMSNDEMSTYERYQIYGREMGYIQDLFPNVPAWIRSGVIDKYSEGFCICPSCFG